MADNSLAWWHQEASLPDDYLSSDGWIKLGEKMEQIWQSVKNQPKPDLVCVNEEAAQRLRELGWIK